VTARRNGWIVLAGVALIVGLAAEISAREAAPPQPPAEETREPGPGLARPRPALRPLKREVAVATIVMGAFILLLGKKLYRIALVVVGAMLGGHAARLAALIAGYGESAFLFSLVGAVAGAAITVPLEFVLRMLLGAIAGMVVLPVMVSAATDSAALVILAAFVGLALGAATTYFCRRAVLIGGFSLIGAGMAAVGVASLRASPGGELSLGGAEVLGMMFATAVGIAFQYSLEAPEEPEEEDGDGD